MHLWQWGAHEEDGQRRTVPVGLIKTESWMGSDLGVTRRGGGSGRAVRGSRGARPAANGRGGLVSGARQSHRGPEGEREKKLGAWVAVAVSCWAGYHGPKSTVQILIYSNNFKSTCIDSVKRQTSRAWQISNKIWNCREWNKEQLSLLELLKIQYWIWIKNQGSSTVWNSIEFDWHFQELMKFEQEAPVCTWMPTQLINRSLKFQTRSFWLSLKDLIWI
jgi:hypothetical protein